MSGGNAREFFRRGFSFPLDWSIRNRGPVKFLLHVGIFVSAYLGAYLVRFEFFIPVEFQSLIKATLLLVLSSKAIAFAVFRLGLRRYASGSRFGVRA